MNADEKEQKPVAEFFWKENIGSGCVICMSPKAERGYVDCIAETVICHPGTSEVVGVIDIQICSACLEQAARLVGCGTPQDFDELVRRCDDAEVELEKTKDEVKAWTQRFNNLVEALGRGEQIAAISISDTSLTELNS